MTLPWDAIVAALGGRPWPMPTGRIAGRYITAATPEDLDPTLVDARELSRLIGCTRQAADQRLGRARASGDYTLLANAINRAIAAGAGHAEETHP